MSTASGCYQWWRKLFIEVGGPSVWCEWNHSKVEGPGPGKWKFFKFKLIKTYLRTSMQEHQLNALALLYINKDIKLDYSQVIDQFAKGNRRLNLK